MGMLIMSRDAAGLERKRHKCLPSIATSYGQPLSPAPSQLSRQNLRHYEYGPAGSSFPGLSSSSKTVPRSSAMSSTKPAITKLTVASSLKRRFGAT
jgi:hypothetical protein